MELIEHQDKVINDIRDFLEKLELTKRIDIAFSDFWKERGVTRMEPYKNNVTRVPHICAKVPTAGGKTFIAVNALAPFFDAIQKANPKTPKFVVWLVPSLPILEQTVKAFSNVDHPYRQRLDLLFSKRVEIYEKKDLMLGAGFSQDTVREQVSIVVMTFDSLRANNKEDRKIFQDNGYLASFLDLDATENNDWLLPEYDPSALINVMRRMKPVVVVDESHNAESKLSVEMLSNLNPSFILDLTATPKNNSNIISYVDASLLKKHHMVKLPVIVANRQNKNEVIEAAIILRRQLEAIAQEEELKSGKHIRPIVLFQAQPKTDDDNITFEKIKQALIELKIPEEQIKIKTATINELKDIDLMDRTCKVRFIITVNALKEGWDCPYAYILASLADKSSAVDVEQILGRVLRMPYVKEHGNSLLNMSYVFTASNRFAETLQSIVKGLNRAGFTDKDYRVLSKEEEIQDDKKAETSNASNNDLFNPANDNIADSNSSDNEAPEDDIDINHINDLLNKSSTDINDTDVVDRNKNDFIDSIKSQAELQNKIYEQAAKDAGENPTPPELEDKMNKYRIKDIFKEDALELKLPQFFIKVQSGGWFDNELQLMERDLLLKDFRLANLDAMISFEDINSEMVRVDLEQIGKEDYSPKPFKINQKDRQKFNQIILSGSRENQIMNLTARLFDLIGNLYPIDDTDVKRYLNRIVEAMDSEQIRDCLDNDVAYVRKIKKKISMLADSHAHKEFVDLLDVDAISVQPNFQLPETIAPSDNGASIPKSLYVNEGYFGDYEAKVITEVANIDSVKWWHRNLSKAKGFRINGFINHYADFIVKTISGRIVILEVKGDDKDNSDSENKLKLGKLWEAKVGGKFKYMMVFDHKPIDGAETLADAIKKIAQL